MINITLEPDMAIEPGHQWIVVPNDPDGWALLKLLCGNRRIAGAGDYIRVPHDAKVDAAIVLLIDVLAHVRFQAPDLIQMTMEETTT